ncbi:hypothetical protein K1719_006956 [Acacia pycnantha]|nr:hypothetical protein K1719_006956 [Acacia pycnantha]
MLAKRLSSFLRSFSKPQISRSIKNVKEEESKPYVRKAVSFVLITITGGVALSALDDLAMYQGCSSKAMEKVSKNQAMIETLGEPIVKGPWYNASLAVAHKRHSVSCSFPVSGPQGTGLLQLKAVRNGDDTWSSFFFPGDWEILVMDALLHVPGNEEKSQTLRIDLSERLPTSCTACAECIPSTAQNPETTMSAKQ